MVEPMLQLLFRMCHILWHYATPSSRTAHDSTLPVACRLQAATCAVQSRTGVIPRTNIVAAGSMWGGGGVPQS